MTVEGQDQMQRTADADRQGVMIALVPSQSASERLLEHSGGTAPLDDQHITLAYLGTLGEEVPDDPATRSRIEEIVRSHGARYAALNGEANGWGVFHNEDDVVVALWNIPGINGLRQSLVDDLRPIAPAKSNFSYTPHQTMGYYQAADHVSAPTRLEHPVKSDFRVLVLVWGGEQMFFPLTGLLHEAKDGPARGGNAKNPGQFSSEDKGFRKKDKGTTTKTKTDTGKGTQEKGQEPASGDARAQDAPGAAEDAQEPQEGTEQAETVEQDAQQEQQAEEPAEVTVEVPEGDNYTGTSYAAISEGKEVLNDEDKRAIGDLYLAPLPAGKYPEGDPRNEPEAERIMAEKEALVAQHIQGPLPDMWHDKVDAPWYDPANAEVIQQWRESGTGGQTRDLHDRLMDPSTGRMNVYTKERSRQHQEILRKYEERYLGYPKEGRAVVMAGPPGAGKSTFLEKFGSEQFGIEVSTKDEQKAGGNPAKNFVTINPDDFKDFLEVDPARYPGLNENELAAIKHEESSFLATQATEFFMSQGYNVIIDITLGSNSSAMKKYYTPWADKYDYQVALVDGDMKNSRNNAGLRWKKPDKDTGKRTYEGRFIPMDVIEKNAPDKPGFRSKNAQEFLDFIKNDKVTKSVVYDPYNAAAGVQPSSAAIHAEARRKAQVSHHGNIGVEGRERPRKEARMSGLRKVGSSGHATTKITEEITKYHQGQITEDALIQFLLEHQYAPQEACPHKPGTADWWAWHEDNGYQPGTWDEVLLARNKGLLSWDTFHKVNDAVVDRATSG